MYNEYSNYIRLFHQGLMQKDAEALRGLLSDSAALSLDMDALEQLDFPLSDDIEVTGIALEGSGEIIDVYYLQKLEDRKYSMVAYLLRVNDSIKLNHFLPILKE